MNSDIVKNNAQSSFNLKGVMEFVQEQMKISTNEWTHEKNLLIKKINDLEKEVKTLRKVNNNFSLKNDELNLTQNDKEIKTKNDHKRVDSDTLKLNEKNLAKIRCHFMKKKINSDDLPLSKNNKKNTNNTKRRKTQSYGAFDKILENKFLETIQNNSNFNSNTFNKEYIPKFTFTMYNNINVNSNNMFTQHQTSFSTINNYSSSGLLKKKEKEINPINTNAKSLESFSNNLETIVDKSTQNQKINKDFLSNKHDQKLNSIISPIKEEIQENLRISFVEKLNTNHLITKKDPSKPSYNPIIVLKSHFDSVRELYITPDSKYIVSVGEDLLVNVWDFKKSLNHNKEYFETYCTMRGHKKPIFSITGNRQKIFSNGFSIYTGGSDGIIMHRRIIENLKDKNEYGNEEMMKNSLAYSWRGHQDSIWQLSHHVSENILSSISSDGFLKIWRGFNEEYYNKLNDSFDPKKKNILRQFTFKNHNYNFDEIPTSSVWSNNKQNSIFVSYIAPYIRCYDIEIGKSTQDYTFQVEKNSSFESTQTNKICVNSRLNMIISGNEDKQIRFYDKNQTNCIKSMVAHTDSVSSVFMGNDENQLLSCSHDGSFRCWDLRKFKLIYDVPAHRKKNDEGCQSIISNSTYQVILTTGADGLIKIFKSS